MRKSTIFVIYWKYYRNNWSGNSRSFCHVLSNDIFYFISFFTTLFLHCI